MKTTYKWVIIALALLFALPPFIILGMRGYLAEPPQEKTASEPVSSAPAPSAPEREQQPEPSAPVPEPETVRATLLAVGDNLIHDVLYNQALRRTGGSGYDFLPVYTAVQEQIMQADIAFINQETMMAKSQPLSNYPAFNSPAELAPQLGELGFDVVNLANNHMLDVGVSGLEETISLLDTVSSITRIGAFHDAQESRLRIVEREGITFAFLGFADYTNASGTRGAPGMVTYTDNREEMAQQLAAARETADVVVVSVHFGEENTTVPTAAQRETAQFFCEQGADIVLGHHPHVIQPVEWLENGQGHKTLVFFSLGNFVSAQRGAANLLGIMPQIPVEKSPEGEVTVLDPEIIPVVTHYGPNYRELQLCLYQDYSGEQAAAHGVSGFGVAFSRSYLEKLLYDTIDEQYLDLQQAPV